MRKVLALLGSGFVGLLVVSAACGGGGDNSSATPSTATTQVATNSATAAPGNTVAATPTAADLANDLATLRSLMQDMISKAQARDAEGAHTEGGGDKAIREIFKALLTKDATLAYELETLKLDYDDNPDLTVIAQDGQKVLDLLGQIATTLGVSY